MDNVCRRNQAPRKQPQWQHQVKQAGFVISLIFEGKTTYDLRQVFYSEGQSTITITVTYNGLR